MVTRSVLSLCTLIVMGLVGFPPVQAQNGGTASLLENFRWRAIGPVNLGGRIADIEAVDTNPYVIYVGAASGGVWKTINNGTTWAPAFDDAPNLSVGDIAIAPSDPNVVWVGTGEANNRQSTSYGSGVFKSTDAGKSWTFVGLGESGHIGRIVIDSKNPNVVYVAAVGDLFKPSHERGLFKTVDGGKTWTNTNYIDENTGFTDVVMDPSDNRILIAASYQRRRTSWGFNGGGPGSALWKSVDGARTWTKLTKGLPQPGQWGRTGLAIARSNPNVVYAVIQPSPTSSQGGGTSTATSADPTRDGLWRSDDKGTTWRIVSNQNGRPMYFSQIRVDPKNADVIYSVARSIAKSSDGGRTFTQVPLEWAQERMQPNYRPADRPQQRRPQRVDLVAPSHHDNHAMWIDPQNTDHLMVGHDGGVDVSYDGGRTWSFLDDWMPLGQFYEVAVDMRRPYYVYGGAQDEGAWAGPSRVRNDGGITKNHWFQMMAGDAWHVRVDPTDWATVYIEDSVNAGGHTWRMDLKTGQQTYMRPTGGREPSGQSLRQTVVPPLSPTEVVRFNWNAPLILSPHNPQVLYFGGNRLFKSSNRGDTWTATMDLTKAIDRNTLPIMSVAGSAPMVAKNDGVGAYGTIISIAESPIVPGLLWVGTDDGNVQMSRDDGASWVNLTDNIAQFPQNYYVESIAASHHDAGTAYVAFDGHHSGDYRPHLFKTTNYGKSWQPITSGLLPRGHVNVVKDDPTNPNLLFVGTETGFYVTLDGGARWTPFMNGLPAAPSDDVVIHPRERDLVLATLGRSFYILDDITPLEQLSDKVLAAPVHLFEIRDAVLWNDDWTAFHGGGEEIFRGENPPEGTYIHYYLKNEVPDVRIQIADVTGAVVREFAASGRAGINRVEWDLRGNPPSAPPKPTTQVGGNGLPVTRAPRVRPGDYVVRLSAGGTTQSKVLKVDRDPNR